MLSNKILIATIAAGLAVAPLSTASAGWRHHGSRSSHGRGLIGGLAGAVVGIATLPVAILASAASSAPRARASTRSAPDEYEQGSYAP
ncbi:MAG TPA: hypothetical protein VGM36_10355, partial [Rhizomicrobium sp.]